MTDLVAILQKSSGWPPDPYKGLNYFMTADAPLFGQREAEINDMISLLLSFDTRAVLLHGETGTGKSSFLRAGLCPRLQQLPAEDGRKFFFLHETQADGSVGDPLLIRATDDPVGRVYEALRKAAEKRASTISDSVCKKVLEMLPGPVPYDRRDAIQPIIAALRALTAPPQRATFVLLVDQAEEVLTLPTVGTATNRRTAFFALIEQICFRSMDLRLIVALRTEYYGRFCSFFRINPTTALTPKSEVGAGLFDYLLRQLDTKDLAGAIRQPTLEVSLDSGLPAPRSVYKFSYKPDTLPDIIANDLVSQPGDASTLPAMQIVCKQLYERVVVEGRRTEITEQDYERFGRAQGAIDAFLNRSLKDAATAAGFPALSETDIDTWSLVLWHVVGRAEGGTVQTLIASEADLLKQTTNRGISEDAARAMLSEMVNPQRRLLRVAGGEGGKPAYSLGHDSLGPSVLRRSQQAIARIETEEKLAEERKVTEALLAKQRQDQLLREERFRWMFKLAKAAFAALMIIAVVVQYAAVILAEQQRATTLRIFAERDATSDFRLKILLLVAATQIRKSWPGSLFVSSKDTTEVLRDVLLRSPIFGGNFDAAAWDANGKSVVRLNDNKVIVRDLDKSQDTKSFALKSIDVKGATAVGLMTSQSGTETVAAFSNAAIKPSIEKVEQAHTILSEVDFDLPTALQEEMKKNLRIYRTEIFEKKFRIVFVHFVGSAMDGMQVLNVSGSTATSFVPQSQTSLMVDWMPLQRRSLRVPVLGEDCNTYAHIGRPEPPALPSRQDGSPPPPPPPAMFQLWSGDFGTEIAGHTDLEGAPETGGAVAIARGCEWVAVRDDSNLNLHLVPINQNATSRRRTVQIELEKYDGIVGLPNAQQTQPMFAAAPLPARRGLRVGWSTARGLAFVDIPPDQSGVSTLASGKNQMLAGVDSGYALGWLSLSPDGSAALMTRQQTWGSPVQTRAFDLNFEKRKKYLKNLSTDKLIAEACRIAKFQNDSNEMESWEQEIWLGKQNSWQPCENPGANR